MLDQDCSSANSYGVNKVISSLTAYSINDFLSEKDIDDVLRVINSYKDSNPTKLQAGDNGVSLHQSTSMSVPEIIAVYEPAGRLEINTPRMPRAVIEIIEDAFYRHIESIRRAYPEAHSLYGFTYVEYTKGQFFTPHIDGGIDRQVAGFGVTLSDSFEGGEFLLYTCGSNRLWTMDARGRAAVAPGHDASSTWFVDIPKTEWATRPKRGNAIFYGSALTHGSRPVVSGTLKKVLAFIH
jgi:hypothetical protein